jgi:hypothetical protein
VNALRPGPVVLPVVLLLLLLLLSLVGPTVPAAAAPVRPAATWDPLQAATEGGDLVLAPEAAGAGGERARLSLPGGRILFVPLPAGAELTALTALAEGRWAAAGTVTAAAGGSELLLLRGDAGSVRTFAAPAGQTGKERRSPVLLAAGGRLLGLAWLEGNGEETLAVRAAHLRANRWTLPETVAPPGPGSQLALTGTVLAGGSWLLAWSAFDGNDDEILWTRSGRKGWLAPRRAAADNQVPDVTPALTATPTGALLAWSRYDGNDYRVVVAQLPNAAGNETWSAPTTVGTAGSVFPSFPSGRAQLLYRSARPRGWTLLDLDPAGRVAQRARVDADTVVRPVISGSSTAGGEPRFAWPDRPVAAVAWERER